MRRIRISVCRRSASPFYLREDKSKWRVVDSGENFSQFATRLARNSDADRVVRKRSLAPSAPAIAGEGDHWSSRSERTVVEGALDSELRFRCRELSLHEDASGRANVSEHRQDSCGASSPAPLPPPCFAGWSPSPAIAGADAAAAVAIRRTSLTLGHHEKD